MLRLILLLATSFLFDLQADTPYSVSDYIWINEFMVEPNDDIPDPPGYLGDTIIFCLQAMFNYESNECGREWVELYNSHPCDAIDISGFFFGAAGTGSNYGTFMFPEGTVIEPLDFLVIGGGDPANSGFIDINLNDYYDDPGHLCHANGDVSWFLTAWEGNLFLFDNFGLPVDHVYYTHDINDPLFIESLIYSNGIYQNPQISPAFGISGLPSLYDVYLANPDQVSFAGAYPSIGNSIKRTVDAGGTWAITPIGFQTPGACNALCHSYNTLSYSISSSLSDCNIPTGSISVTILGGSYPGLSYIWQDMPGLNTGSRTGLSSGTYHLTILNGNGCYYEEDFIINNPSLIVSAPDYEMCIGDPVPQISVSGYGQIEWYIINNTTGVTSPGTSSQVVDPTGLITSTYTSNLFIPDGQGPITSYTHTFIVQFYDANTGCADIDSLSFEIGSTPGPVSINPISGCAGQQLPPITAPNDIELNFYQYGNLVFQGTSFVPPVNPNLATTYLYQVAANSNGCAGPVTDVFYTINTEPPPPLALNAVSVCSNGSIPTLSATGNNLQWSSEPAGGTILGTGGSFTPSGINLSSATSFTYYVQSSAAGGCASTRVPVVINVTSPPTAPLVENMSLCIGDEIPSFHINSPLTVHWYGSINGPILATSNSFTPPIANPSVIDSPYTFYASINNGTCESEKTAFTLSFTAVEPPLVENIGICSGDDLIPLLAMGAATINWYDSPTGGNILLANSLSFLPTNASDPGVYTYFAEASDGNCESTRVSVQLEVFDLPILTPFTSAFCEGSEGAMLEILSPYDLSWYDAAAGGNLLSIGNSYSPSIASIPAGQDLVLYVEPLDANGCIGDPVPYTLSILPLPTISPTIEGTTCTQADGSISNVITSASSPLTQVVWTDENDAILPHINGDLINVLAGTYYVELTDAAECKNELIFVINNTDGPQLIGGELQPASCNLNNGSITGISVIYGTDFSLQWLNQNNEVVGSTLDLLGISPGAYTLRLESIDGCIATAAFVLEALPLPQIMGGELTNESCGAADGAINNITLINTGNNYSIEWMDEAGNPLGQNTTEINGLSAGIYTLTVNVDGCYVSRDFTILNLPGPEIQNLDITNATCGLSNGSAGNVIILNDSNLSYTWLDVNGEVVETDLQNIVELAPGSYTLSVQASLLCTDEYSFEISNTPGPQLSGGITVPASCGESNGAIGGINLIPGSGASVIQWTDIEGQIISEDLDLTNLAAGLYTLTVTDINNCIATATYNVTNSSGPQIIGANASPATCGFMNGSIENLQISGGEDPMFIYWYDAQNNVLATDIYSLNNLAAGNYHIQVVDNNGCEASVDMIINSSSGPIIGDATIEAAHCDGTGGNITSPEITSPEPPVSFSWTASGDNVLLSSTPDLLNVPPGAYALSVEDINGCVATHIFNIPQAEGPALSGATVLPASCGNEDGAITDIITSGNIILYEWQNSSETVIGNTPYLLNVGQGTYTLTITDENNCIIENNYDVPELGGPEITGAQVTPSSCGEPNGSISNLLYDGEVNAIAWYNEVGLLFSVDTEITDLPAGDYTLQISNDGGCADSQVFHIEESTAPQIISALLIDATCNQANGEITDLIISGDVLEWEWYNVNNVLVSTNESIQDIESGSYRLLITDANGCTDEEIFAINNTDGPALGLATIQTESCSAQNGAIIQPQISPPNAVITYEWTNSSGVIIGNEDQLQNLPAGIYTLTITDQNNCSSSAFYTVEALPATIIQDATITPDACSQGIGSITDVVLSGNTPVIAYSWEDADGNLITMNPALYNQLSGSYTLSITDENGCIDEMNFEIPHLSGPEITDATIQEAFCGGNNGSISNITYAGGTGQIVYQWYVGGELIALDMGLENIGAGSYILRIIDENGCLDEMEIRVGEIPGPSVNLTADGVLSCIKEEVVLYADASSALLQVLWLYNDLPLSGANTNSLEAQLPGIYTVQVIDPQTHCQAEDQIEVMEQLSAPQVEAGEDLVIFEETDIVPLSGTINGVGDLYLVEWIGPDGDIVSTGANTAALATVPGIYIIRLTDLITGCTDEDELEITLVEINESLVNIPNAFSPNADGVNDVFRILGSYISSSDMSIYDRWGRKIAFIPDAMQGWDGRILAAQEAEIGVYAYVVRLVFADGSPYLFKGNVTLIR